jgi:hypothetical protein
MSRAFLHADRKLLGGLFEIGRKEEEGMTRAKFNCILSALLLGSLGATASLCADTKGRAAENDTLVLDVAIDAQTLSYTRPDAWGSGPMRGDTFIVTGRIFAGGTIPDGDTTNTFGPDADGSIGSLVSTGVFTTDAATIAAGAPFYASTTHLFQLDSGDGMVSQGLEGVADAVRAVIGGTGAYSGAIGQVTEQVLGSNGTGGKNLRLTFQIARMNPQDPGTVQSMRKARRRQ